MEDSRIGKHGKPRESALGDRHANPTETGETGFSEPHGFCCLLNGWHADLLFQALRTLCFSRASYPCPSRALPHRLLRLRLE
jgi:hypothetical protein